MTHETCWVGVDVSKATLDVYLSCPEQALSVSNDPAAIPRLPAILPPERDDLHAAGRAGIGATVGLLLGTAAKMAIAFGMVGFFLFARFL